MIDVYGQFMELRNRFTWINMKYGMLPVNPHQVRQLLIMALFWAIASG